MVRAITTAKKAEETLTEDQVHARLLSLLNVKYKGDLELMALGLRIRLPYLKVLLKGGRMPPRWLLERIGVFVRRHTVSEYYIEN